MLEGLVQELKAPRGGGLAWRPTTETPETDDELVVVKTTTGAKYFGSTINGRWMSNVAAWSPLPKD